MPAHDSQYPEENKSRTIRVDATGISMNWRSTVIAILTILVGGGGYTGFQFITEAELDEAIVKSETKLTKQIGEIKEPVKKNTEAIGVLTATIGKVAKIQNQDIAVREARRVVGEEIKCRLTDNGCNRRRDMELERLRRMNVKRLESEGEICSSLECR